MLHGPIWLSPWLRKKITQFFYVSVAIVFVHIKRHARISMGQFGTYSNTRDLSILHQRVRSIVPVVIRFSNEQQKNQCLFPMFDGSFIPLFRYKKVSRKSQLDNLTGTRIKELPFILSQCDRLIVPTVVRFRGYQKKRKTMYFTAMQFQRKKIVWKKKELP